jgi:hypothetical protein
MTFAINRPVSSGLWTRLMPSIQNLAFLAMGLGILAAGLPAPARSAPRTHSTRALAADLRQMRNLLESQHPALYAFTDRKTFDSLFVQAQDLIDRPMTSREFYQIAAPIVARVGCGHTTLTMATDSLTRYADRFFPLPLFIVGDRAFVRRTAVAAGDRREVVAPGAELLTVNGIAVPALLARMRAAISADGGNDGWKTTLLNGTALYDLYALLFGFPDAFELTFRPAAPGSWGRSGLRRATLPAVSRRDAIDRLLGTGGADSTTTGDPHIHFALDKGRETAVLAIRTFAYYKSREKYYAIIDGVFDRLRAAGCRNLILDLRGNSGGDPFCSAHLLPYVAPASAPYFARVYPSYASLANPLPFPENRFRGSLYTLINGGCFSSTGHLCALFKFHQIGTFIGSETGGTYECNDAARTDTLRTTGLRLRVARATYTVAVENLSRAKGVSPDYVVEPSIRDVLSRHDPVMERAWSLIERRVGDLPLPCPKTAGALRAGGAYCAHATNKPAHGGSLLPGGTEPGCPLRRAVLHCGAHDRYLLPPDLPRGDSAAAERAFLPLRGRGRGSRVPSVPPVPARRRAGHAGLAGHVGHGAPRSALY